MSERAGSARASDGDCPDQAQRAAPTGGEEWMTTEMAATYLGYTSASSLRSLTQRGHLRPDGRRGPHGPHMFRKSTLDAFLEGCVETDTVVDASNWDFPGTSATTNTEEENGKNWMETSKERDRHLCKSEGSYQSESNLFAAHGQKERTTMHPPTWDGDRSSDLGAHKNGESSGERGRQRSALKDHYIGRLRGALASAKSETKA